MKRQLALTLSLSLLCNLSFASEPIFTNSERVEIKSVVVSTLQPIWSDPHIRSCWSHANLGSDKALSALYLISLGRSRIDEIAKKRQDILASSKSSKEAYRQLKDTFNENDIDTLNRSVLMLPKSWKYCELIHNKFIIKNTNE